MYHVMVFALFCLTHIQPPMACYVTFAGGPLNSTEHHRHLPGIHRTASAWTDAGLVTHCLVCVIVMIILKPSMSPRRGDIKHMAPPQV